MRTWLGVVLSALLAVACGGGAAQDAGTPPADSGTPGEDAGLVADGGPAQDAGCVVSAEVCDGLDNDCDGVADNGIDFASPAHCGTCANDCYELFPNTDPAATTCQPSGTPGVKGTCVPGPCAPNYHDLDAGSPGCERYCVPTASNDSTCDGQDDDCDGRADEDVNLCNSTAHCGACGAACAAPHATSECAHTGSAACDTSNTACRIAQCECSGAGNCFWDLDQSYANGCEYLCTATGPEVCDGVDNDCDGKIDLQDDLSQDARLGVTCVGSPLGLCGTAAHQGTTACGPNGTLTCAGAAVLRPGDTAETCNNVDDDCDGQTDDDAAGTGVSCGASATAPCVRGVTRCQSGTLSCVGAVEPAPESCNGIDDDCDGTPDNNLAGVGAPCSVPPSPPAGATSACTAGATACLGGALRCQGAVLPAVALDACGVDSNCDGALTNQPSLTSDARNCGACGVNCAAGKVHSVWSCVSGTCTYGGCETGYYDLNNDQACEYPCTFVSATEACNGADDNCNGLIDEGVVPPAPSAVCGTGPNATAPECTSAVSVVCQSGAWKCTFPANVCSPTCAAGVELCDGLDNNCNGLADEHLPALGVPCASDDGLPPGSHGACRTTGQYVCNGTTGGVRCSATKAACETLPGGCAELCDGVDNDCDGLVDEPFNNKGPNATYFVKPTVTRLASALWMYSFEASRPNATLLTPGTGNGYRCASFNPGLASCNDITIPVAPAGVTLDAVPACSVSGKAPWFNVAAAEAEQICKAAGGALCTPAEFQLACEATATCTWAYNPRGLACTLPSTASKFCNLGAYDFNAGALGDQDGLLPTAAPELLNCFADWSSLQGNTSSPAGPYNRVMDLTGNLRELTRVNPGSYAAMGGSFLSTSDTSAACSSVAYPATPTFKQPDVGFRCCFGQNPGL